MTICSISATEWLEQVAPNDPQWRPEDAIRLAPILAEHGVDLLDVSSGGIDSRQRMIVGEAYQAHFAGAIKEAVGEKLLVGSVGGLGSGPVAEKVLEKGQADVVFVGRQFQKNPGLVWKMADELGVGVVQAKQIGWGFYGRGRIAPNKETKLWTNQLLQILCNHVVDVERHVFRVVILDLIQ